MTKLLTSGEAAEYCRLSTDFLHKARCYRTDGPRFIRLGRSIRYDISDLDEWLNSHRRACVAPAPQSADAEPAMT